MSSISSSTQAQVRTVQYTHTCTCTCVHQVYAQVHIQYMYISIVGSSTHCTTYIHISVVLVNYSCITKTKTPFSKAF